MTTETKGAQLQEKIDALERAAADASGGNVVDHALMSKLLDAAVDDLNKALARLEDAEELLAVLSSGYWKHHLDEASFDGERIGERVQAYWRKHL